MVAAYLLTAMNFPYVMAALGIGMIAAAVVGYLVGLIALRRTGIYFAMITVAKGQCFSEARLFRKTCARRATGTWSEIKTGCSLLLNGGLLSPIALIERHSFLVWNFGRDPALPRHACLSN
jgi:tetrahydromethanopterin S-methyltransferase subunit C